MSRANVTILRPTDTAAWLAARREGIGSSELATLLGVNAYESPYQLLERKRGERAGESQPREETLPMRLGHYMENAVAQCFADETGYGIIKRSATDWIAVDCENPCLRVSPDRTYWITDENGRRVGKRILECKTTQRDVTPADYPMEWYCQVQYQMGVTGLHHAHLACLKRGREFWYVKVPFDAAFYEEVKAQALAFWHDCVLGGGEPQIIRADDIALKYDRVLAKATEASPEVMEALRKLREAKETIKAMEEDIAEWKNTIKCAFADGDTLTHAGQIVATWKETKPRATFDRKAFEKQYPDLAPQFIRERSVTRVFRIK